MRRFLWEQRYRWGLVLAAVSAPVISYFLISALGPWPGGAASAVLIAALALAGYRQVEQQQQLLSAAAEREAEEARRAAVLLEQSRCEQVESQRRLQAVITLNHQMAEARSEAELMNAALSTLTDLVGALGCSFVPVDEWDQPLPPFTHGRLPGAVLAAWAGHLTGTALRERCGRCAVLHSTPGQCPLHPESVGSSISVYCLPLLQTAPALKGAGDRRLGILHLYLPPGEQIDAGAQQFLEGLLKEMALAIQSVRLRDQEINTLKQIRMLHAAEGGVEESLSGLVTGLQQAVDARFVLLRLRPLPEDRQPGLSIERGVMPGAVREEVDALFPRVLEGKPAFSPEGLAPAWLALPAGLPEGQVTGMLLLGASRARGFSERERAVAQTVAAQAALLVENDRLFRSLEYRAVIQERTRLAREIHDGLAQTLAFLKLQVAQMQTFFDKGDQSRLAQVLKENYQALSEAYLDARQAIDNLRLAPTQRIETWLEQSAADFENASGLKVDRKIQALTAGWTEALSPEIQAQLMRIVQEGFNNIRKHSGAGRAWINFYEWQDDLVLEIKDDGRGFDADEVPEFSRHGLRGMRERAEMIGADFQIISQARQGTTVRLTLPAFLKETNR